MPSPLRYTADFLWRRAGDDRFYGVIALLLLSLFGSLLAPYALDQQFLGYQLLPPSWSRYGNVSFFLGTDDLRRDILSRLLTGTAATFGSALAVTLAAAFCGNPRRVRRRHPRAALGGAQPFSIPCCPSRRCCWRSWWWRLSAQT